MVLALKIVALQPTFAHVNTPLLLRSFTAIYSLMRTTFVIKNNLIYKFLLQILQCCGGKDSLLPTPSHGRDFFNDKTSQTNASFTSRGHSSHFRKTRGFNPRGNRPPSRCKYNSLLGHITQYCP